MGQYLWSPRHDGRTFSFDFNIYNECTRHSRRHTLDATAIDQFEFILYFDCTLYSYSYVVLHATNPVVRAHTSLNRQTNLLHSAQAHTPHTHIYIRYTRAHGSTHTHFVFILSIFFLSLFHPLCVFVYLVCGVAHLQRTVLCVHDNNNSTIEVRYDTHRHNTAHTERTESSRRRSRRSRRRQK